MREKSKSSDRAKAVTKVVLPIPGTSSIRTCPPAVKAISKRRMVLLLPTITCETLFSIASAKAQALSGFTAIIVCSFIPEIISDPQVVGSSILSREIFFY